MDQQAGESVMGDVGDTYREFKDEIKARRKYARDKSAEDAASFFTRKGVKFEVGVNTLIFRTKSGTVVYYPPSGRMQFKNEWYTCGLNRALSFILSKGDK